MNKGWKLVISFVETAQFKSIKRFDFTYSQERNVLLSILKALTLYMQAVLLSFGLSLSLSYLKEKSLM